MPRRSTHPFPTSPRATANLALAGGADAVSGLFRATIWNTTVPDELRGRLAGLEMLSWSSGPTLGNAEAGFAASVLGLRASVIVGGAACVGGCALVARALPAFWRYDARHVTPASVPPARTSPVPMPSSPADPGSAGASPRVR